METIKAVVGIIKNKDSKFLIAERKIGSFMYGYWELPGGKINFGETPENAIIRELEEELGIKITNLNYLRTVTHKYPDRLVELQYFLIEKYKGSPYGVEGQKINWVYAEGLANYKLLPCVKDVLFSLSIDPIYWITPETEHYTDQWMHKFDEKINQGVKLIQLRAKHKIEDIFIKNLYTKCRLNNAKLLLNTVNKTFNDKYTDGWHLTTKELLSLNERPLNNGKIIAASTHNLDEANIAKNLDIDFIVVSPIRKTKTHPESKPLGWKYAKMVASSVTTPVYFLGGMNYKDLDRAKKNGAQGVAGVSSLM